MNALKCDEKWLPFDVEVKKTTTEELDIPFVKEKLSLESDDKSQHRCASDDDSGCPLDEFSWVPPDIQPKLVRQYMRSLPETKIPYVGSVGDRYRTVQLLRQLPVQDSSAKYCHGLSDEEKKELSVFAECRRKDSLGRGVVRLLDPSESGSKCKECQRNIKAGDVAVMASRLSEDAFWHPRCFTCHQCKELLVDLVYFLKDEHIFCGRHHAELVKPRCIACDELIFTEECTEAEGQMWHMKHFTCNDCEGQLGGQRYVMRDGHPICCGCYDASHAERCRSCNEPIGIDHGLMELNGQRWHATDDCFRCDACREPLVGRHFMCKDDVLYCSVCALIDFNETNSASDKVCEGIETRSKAAASKGSGQKSVIGFDSFDPALSDNDCGADFETSRSLWKEDLKRKNATMSGVTGVWQNAEMASGESLFDRETSIVSERRRNPGCQLSASELIPSISFCDAGNDSHLSKEEELIEMYQNRSSHTFDEDSKNLYKENVSPSNVTRRGFRNFGTENHDSSFQIERLQDVDSRPRCSKGKSGSTAGVFDLEDSKLSRMMKARSAIPPTVSEELELPRGKKSVRFDPSTKGALTPSPRAELRHRLKHRNRAPAFSQDDWDVWSEDRDRRRRTSGYSSDGGLSKTKRSSGYFSDTAAHRSKSHAGSNWLNEQRAQWLAHETSSRRKRKDALENDYDMFEFRDFECDNIEKCSTCSSSSDSSDFYDTTSMGHASSYGGENLGSPTFQMSSSSYSYSDRCQTLPSSSSSRVSFADPGAKGKKKKKRQKKTNCTIS